MLRPARLPLIPRLLRLGLFALLLACFLFAGLLLVTTARRGRLQMGRLDQVGRAYYPRDDWVAFYSAGSLLRNGHGAAVYDLAGIRAAEDQATGGRLPPDFTMPFFNPPYALLLLAPLAGLSIATSGIVWTAGGTFLFVAGLALLLATYPRRMSPVLAGLTLLGAVSSHPVLDALELGQFTFLIGLGVCLLFVSLRRPHPAYPILGLLLLSLKPQLLPLPLLFLLVQHRYRALAGAAAAAGALLLLTILFAGPHMLLDWLRLTGQATVWDNQYTISSFRQYGWIGLVAGLFGPGHVVQRRLLVTALDVVTIAGVGLAIYHGRRAGRGDAVLLALATIGALLASANLNLAETLLIIPVLLVLYQELGQELGRRAVALVAVAGWFVTYLQAIVINSAFLMLRPSFGMVRDSHANSFILGLSYINPGTLYLLALLLWLGRYALLARRAPLTEQVVAEGQTPEAPRLEEPAMRSAHASLVIVPTYNERENLVPFVNAVLAVEPDLDLLVVDDNSPDGTGRLAGELAEREPRVKVLHRPGKLGLGTAYIAGFRYALAHGYERIVEMDADFSHRPEDLPLLLEASETADLVIGSRNVPGGRVENWSPMRHLISKGGSLYARLLLRLPVRDCTGGFKCFRRAVLEALDLDAVRSNGYSFQIELNYLCHRAGFRIVEVPIVFPDRAAGRSKMSRRIVLEAALRVWQLRLHPAAGTRPDATAHEAAAQGGSGVAWR